MRLDELSHIDREHDLRSRTTRGTLSIQSIGIKPKKHPRVDQRVPLLRCHALQTIR
jgi:hypothetical protein